MKIAIIGAGNVGGTLGTAWAQKAGHDIFFGVRDAKSEKTQARLSKIGGTGARRYASGRRGVRRLHRFDHALAARPKPRSIRSAMSTAASFSTP